MSVLDQRDDVEAKSRAPTDLVERQYELAGQYPDDYVVLVGERILHHSPDREEALTAFQRVAESFYPERPALVRPGGCPPRRRPMARGRSLSGKLRKRS